MVKEASTMKKKRKVSSGEVEQIDIYKKVCEFEEKESQRRNPTTDADLFFIISEEISYLLKQLHAVKQSAEDASDARVFLTEIAIKICVIKKLNRIDKLSQVSAKEALNIEKQKCDSIKLTFQNLVYELHHLMAEINKCLSFKSEDEDIELVPLKDFMRDASDTVTQPFINYDPDNSEQAHALRLLRLEWELKQRKNLAQECKALEVRKKKVEEEITERQQKLKDLLPLLRVTIKAAKPLQEHLGLSNELTRKEHKLAHLLPNSLYILYANIVAYKSVFATTLNVSILGDKDDATQFNEAQEVSHSNNLNEDDSEPESDLPEVEEVVEVKKRRHRKSVQQVDPVEEKKKKLLEVHPLTIELSISVPNGPALNIVFSYYTKIKIVTAKSTVDIPSNITANTSREILAGHNILSELLENDTGLESPNPSTSYQLRKLGLGSFQSLIPDIGYPYEWAQAICGIDFLTTKKSCGKLSQQNVEVILKVIKKRLITRSNLSKQMQQLEQNILPTIPENVDIPKDVVSSLSKFAPSTYQNFCLANYTQHLIEENFVSSSDLFYFTKIIRSEASLQAYIVIKNTYPVPPPIFALSLNYKGNFSSINCDEIRDLEKTLNIDWNCGTLSSPWLLSAQLTHLCSYLDVYLETLDPKVFHPNIKFLRSFSGRNKKRPFKFRKIGTGIFTQY